jgi:hypothetical protein
MWKKALVISALMSFITTLFVTLLTGRGYKYEPGISSTEMETLTYQEVVTLMQQRQVQNSPWEYLSNVLSDPYFLLALVGQWLVLAVVIFLSCWVFVKWHAK